MTLSILLIPLFIFLLAFIAFAFSALYHVIRFELLNIFTISVTALFIAGTILIGIVSTSYISKIDWSQKIELSFYTTYEFNETKDPNSNNALTF